MILNNKQREAMRVILDDLAFLETKWNERPSDSELRRYSSVLRLLFVQDGGLVQKVADIVDAKIYIVAPVNPLDLNPVHDFELYIAGGGNYRGAVVTGLFIINRVLNSEETKAINKKRTAKYLLQDFISAPSVIYNNKVHSRASIIKYVSNKLGSTHFEFDIEKMSSVKGLEKLREFNKIVDRDPIFYEILSIGQLLTKSKYISKFKKKLQEVI